MSRLEALVDAYDRDHRHPTNRRLHLVGITLIGASLPLLAIRPGLGAATSALGWALQFVGHAIEGKPPTFTQRPRFDPLFLAAGALWYGRRVKELFTAPRASEPG